MHDVMNWMTDTNMVGRTRGGLYYEIEKNVGSAGWGRDNWHTLQKFDNHFEGLPRHRQRRSQHGASGKNGTKFRESVDILFRSRG
jgi:hypothetical protein